MIWASIVFFFSVLPVHEGLFFRINYFDKAMHFFEFAVLAFILSRTFRRVGVEPRAAVAFTLILTLLYGILLELVQDLIPGRTPSFGDVLANLSGAAAGLYLWKAVLWRK